MDIIAKFLTVLSLRNSPNLDFTLQIGLTARKPRLWLSLLTGREGQYGGNTANPRLWLSLLTGREGQYGGNTANPRLWLSLLTGREAKIGLASVRPV